MARTSMFVAAAMTAAALTIAGCKTQSPATASDAPAGSVASTDPGAGTSANDGDTVTVHPSNGRGGGTGQGTTAGQGKGSGKGNGKVGASRVKGDA